jgi:hypothetical protein
LEFQAKRKAAIRSYSTSLAQDNYWCIPCDDDGAVWWFLDGDSWSESLVATLDRCLERIVYFGRAETFTRICSARCPTLVRDQAVAAACA